MRFRKPKFYFHKMYSTNFWFCLGWKPEMMRAYLLDRFGYEKDFTRKSGTTIELFDENSTIILIWTRTESDLECLVHECFHGASITLENIGYKFDPDNEEPFAYLIQDIFSQATGGKYG